MISFWGTTIGNFAMTFLIAMIPVLELRAAIPAGVIARLNIQTVLAAAIMGNLLPIPFIIVFIRKIFKWMQSKSPWLANIVAKLEAKADKKKAQVLKYEFWGLMLFVAIPLPGTDTIEAGTSFKQELPAYSFTVIRLKTQKGKNKQ